MRGDASAYLNKDIVRNVLLELWPSSSPAEIIDGSAAGQTDLSPYATSIRATESKLTVDLRYYTAFLECANQPKPGYVITVKTDGVVRFNGVIESISSYNEERGQRSMEITARLRDGFGAWRTAHATSPVFPQGTSYLAILTDICGRMMGLDASEFNFPSISYTVPHTNSQMADQTPFDMLRDVLFAADYEPFVDVMNRVTAYTKSITRDANAVIDSEKIVKVHGSTESQKTTRVRLKWLDPELKKTSQQDQVLYSASMTAGFFNLRQREKTWFSDDRTQRAEGTYMVTKDSVNAGIVPVAEEKYEQIDLYHGRITLETYFWVPTLATASLAAMTYSALTPDGVAVTETVPIGRVIEMGLQVAVFITMMSMGVGRYEIRGVPFDYVNAKNTTLAYADNIDSWAQQEEEVENDLIANEAHAQQIATNHLVWLAAQSFSYGLTMVDDPRVELGDILEFEDGTRVMVQGFSNDYTRGAPAVMEISGFRV